MSRTNKMIFLVLIAGTLSVAVVLTFIALGVFHPVPWLLVASLLIIPFLMSRSEKQHYVEWKDEYSVGVKSIDDDHKKLLNLINNFQTAVRYRTGKAFEKESLDEVIAYTKYHFDREEKMMQEAGYPDIEAHKEIHRAMIAKTDDFFLALCKELASFLRFNNCSNICLHRTSPANLKPALQAAINSMIR